MTEKAEKPRQKWNQTKLGSLFLAPDFLGALAAALLLGSVPALSQAAQKSMPAIFISLGGASLALVSVVLAAHALVTGLISTEYLEVVARTKGGVASFSRPYLRTVRIAALAALVDIAVALLWPTVPVELGGWWTSLKWALTGSAVLMTFWAVLGGAGLVRLSAFHVEQRSQLRQILSEVRQRGRN